MVNDPKTLSRAAEARTRELSQLSRYVDTKIFNINGRATFGIWRQPRIILDGDEQQFTITAKEEGSLEFIADQFYGTGELWWAIAAVNGFLNVTHEVLPGTVITIPKIERVREAIIKSAG